MSIEDRFSELTIAIRALTEALNNKSVGTVSAPVEKAAIAKEQAVVEGVTANTGITDKKGLSAEAAAAKERAESKGKAADSGKSAEKASDAKATKAEKIADLEKRIEETGTDSELTYDDVKASLQKVGKALGRPAAVDLLGAFAVDNLQKLEKEQWAAFKAKAEELLKGAK
jgi:hypothetical protein